MNNTRITNALMNAMVAGMAIFVYSAIRSSDPSQLTSAGDTAFKIMLPVIAAIFAAGLGTSVVQRKPMRNYQYHPEYIVLAVALVILVAEFLFIE